MKHNRLYKIFGVLIVTVMILTACAPATSQPTTPPTAVPPTQGAAPTAVPPTKVPPTAVPPTAVPPTTAPSKTTIIIGTTDKIASLDPADAYAVHDWEMILNVNDGLLRFKPGTTDLEPVLATALPTISSDGLTYTFTLKDGIKLADGTPLDATMYAAQLNRLLTIGSTCPNDVADSLAVPFVKSIEAPDAKTIVFTLKVPVAFFLKSWLFPLMSRQIQRFSRRISVCCSRLHPSTAPDRGSSHNITRVSRWSSSRTPTTRVT